jgi:hypothetical protein
MRRHGILLYDPAFSVWLGIAGCCFGLTLVTRTAPAQEKRQPAAPSASVSTAARANADPQGERELRAILADIHRAILQHDGTVIERHYSPDYVMTFNNGNRGDFENSLRVLTDESRNKWSVHDTSNERFLFYGDTAIVTFAVHSQWSSRGTEFDIREHLTQTWIRRDGRWTLIATQATLIRQ